MIAAASETYDWQINLSSLARIWTNGCIIRSTFMENCVSYFEQSDELMDHQDLMDQISQGFKDVKTLAKLGIDLELPMPTFNAALTYWNSLKTDPISANLIQAQRDYFGAHTYRRVDRPEEKSYHTQWIEI